MSALPEDNSKVGLNTDPNVTRRLYGLLLPYRRAVAWGMTFLTLSVAAELYPPLVWGKIIDHGLTRQGNTFSADWSYIGWQLALLVAVFAVQQVLSAWRGLLLEKAGQQLTLDLRLRLYGKLAGQSASYFESQRTGNLMSILNDDINQLERFLNGGANQIIQVVCSSVMISAVFFSLQKANWVICFWGLA